MLSAAQELYRLRNEARYLRIHTAQLNRAWTSQKNRADKLSDDLKEREQKIRDLEKENQHLKEEIEKIKKQRDTYKGMVFKPNQVSKDVVEEIFSGKKKSRGGVLGHKGFGRNLPGKVDKSYHLFFHHCPHCNSSLKRTEVVISHTVTDIPAPKETSAIVSCYESERQWCKKCKVEVCANPSGVIPRCRLGINLITQILIWKYKTKLPLKAIVDNLSSIYDVRISVGGIQQILHRTKVYFGRDYEIILKEIRGSPVRHADETGHRIAGVNGWLWEFLTRNAVYYTIEETRGKGVPEKVLGEIKEDSVLIHDDYSSYQNLPGGHQSCWAHLLRNSHEQEVLGFASKEMKELHAELKEIFSQLQRIAQLPFDPQQRQEFHQEFMEHIDNIIQRNYQITDAQIIQKRIKNQGKNLLTALLFPNVPLTNNLAERNIRPMVIARKISGGSRSTNGAETLAVNSSIIQTVKLKNQPIFPTLKDMLLKGAIGRN